ncbi:MAG TPA: tRNA pseudouridine(55) synthase TruB [Edaphocola sp.]|nr:tRNA pseudouridine(55) synthase TruB [Edaphocola sp.]
MRELPSLAAIKEGAVILVDKPLTWTSFDALNKIRKQIHTKIGHCGTLDPLATGLLICCTGKMTKQITGFQQQPKEYTGSFHLGASTPTYDLESTPENFKNTDNLNAEIILSAAESFLGATEQIPPVHSAIKMGGKRVYELAREGKAVQMKPRQIIITEFEITKIELPEVYFRIACSTGTYIRSIAKDFGDILGCGAYLSSLCRTRIGDFHVDDAPSVAEWIEYFRQQG